MNANIKIKLIHYAKKIGLLIIILVVLYFVSQIIVQLGGSNNNANVANRASEIEKSYNTPIYSTKYDLDDKKAKKYVDGIKEYIGLCNNKNYEKAYAMLEENYKTEHMNNLEKFKEYVDVNFAKTQEFSYKNVYNQKDYSIYNIKLFDDIMKYGSNSYYDNSARTYEYTIHNVNDEIKISLNSFINKVALSNNINEDGIQIKLISKSTYYDRVSIKMEISNNSDKIFTFNTRDMNYIKKHSSEYKKYENSMKYQAMIDVMLLPNEKDTVVCNFENYIFTENQSDFAITIVKAYLYDFNDIQSVIKKDLSKVIKNYTDMTISL